MNFEAFIKLISKVKNKILPAETSQFKMSPPFRLELLKLQKEKMKQAKKSAVLALFYPNEFNETTLALILRNTYKGVHSAQISFPGGKVEDSDDSLEMTALRETEEEIGVPRDKIQILKAMTQVYIPPSNFNVQPFIGIIEQTPQFVLEASEVQSLIEVPLSDFFNDESITTKKVSTSYKVDVEVPAFKFNDHIVWGATAMMLSEIKDLLKQVL